MGFKFMTAVQSMVLPGTSPDRLVMCTVLTKMAGHADNQTGDFWVTYKTLAREAHCSEISVKRAVPKLIALGLVKVIDRKITRKGFCPVYRMNLEAIEALGWYQRDTKGRVAKGSLESEGGITRNEGGIRESEGGIRESGTWYPSDTQNLSFEPVREEVREDVRSSPQDHKTGDERQTVAKTAKMCVLQELMEDEDEEPDDRYSLSATVGVTAPHSAVPPKTFADLSPEMRKRVSKTYPQFGLYLPSVQQTILDGLPKTGELK